MRNAFTGLALQVINESCSDKSLEKKLPIVERLIRDEFIRIASNLSADHNLNWISLSDKQAWDLLELLAEEIDSSIEREHELYRARLQETYDTLQHEYDMQQARKKEKEARA